jgi:hypothetical protein
MLTRPIAAFLGAITGGQTTIVEFNGVVPIDTNLTGTFTPVGTTPLPAALPLFATGLGALGLLG